MIALDNSFNKNASELLKYFGSHFNSLEGGLQELRRVEGTINDPDINYEIFLEASLLCIINFSFLIFLLHNLQLLRLRPCRLMKG